MYLPIAQVPPWNLVLVLRGRAGAPVAPAALRRLVAAVDPTMVVLGGKTLQDELENQLRPHRTASAWIAVFGAIALLLASIGLYGVVAQGVLQRTRELAVRAALGASPQGILRAVLGDGMRLVAIGGVAGGLTALATFRVLQSLFTGVQAVDMRSAALAAAILVIGMLLAGYLPARRAARLNPLDALRCE
jgi:ABC-type antimicrobial peptide transport system permease subunit